MAQADGRPKWPPKPEKTAEDLAAIAFLDELREAKGEQVPENLPLACIVKVTEYIEVPKANEAYAMVRVVGRDGCSWRMCVRRGSVKTGKNVLEVTVANLLANQLGVDAVRDRILRDFQPNGTYERFQRPFDKLNHESGLFGPVRFMLR